MLCAREVVRRPIRALSTGRVRIVVLRLCRMVEDANGALRSLREIHDAGDERVL